MLIPNNFYVFFRIQHASGIAINDVKLVVRRSQIKVKIFLLWPELSQSSN